MTRITIEQMLEVKAENIRHLTRYVNFINSRPERELHQKGFDTHHIYPKSLAKKNEISDYDSDWNLIELTLREHFIAHIILFYCGYIEMTYAFWRMRYDGRNYTVTLNSKQYQKLREEHRFVLRESLKDTVWINNGFKSVQLKPNTQIPEGWSIGFGVAAFNKGKIAITNGIRKTYTACDSEIPSGWWVGQTYNRKDDRDKIWINDGKNRKLILKSDEILVGWTVGMMKCENRVYSKRFHITDGIVNKNIAENEDIPLGFRKGSIPTNRKAEVNKRYTNGFETKAFLPDEVPLGWTRGAHYHTTKGMIAINDGINVEWVDSTKSIPNGWIKGRLKAAGIKGKIAINNGTVTKFILKDDIIPVGYVLGGKIRKIL